MSLLKVKQATIVLYWFYKRIQGLRPGSKHVTISHVCGHNYIQTYSKNLFEFAGHTVMNLPDPKMPWPVLPYPTRVRNSGKRTSAGATWLAFHTKKNKRVWRTESYRWARALYNLKSIMKLSQNPAPYTREGGTSWQSSLWLLVFKRRRGTRGVQ